MDLALLAAEGGSKATPILLGLGAALLAAIFVGRYLRTSRDRRAAEGSAAPPDRRLGTKDFWALVEEAREAAGSDPQHRPAALQRLLKALEPSDIERFDARYREVRADGATEDLRLAAHVVRGGVDDVTFGHVRDWLISEGRAVYESAVRDPETIAELGRREVTVLEAYGYAAKRAYKSAANAPLAGTAREEAHSTSTPQWDATEAARRFPRLVAVYS